MRKTLNFRNFDAELNTDRCDPINNAELTLTLRLGFRQINPPAGADAGIFHDYGISTNEARKIIRWEPDAWTNWKNTLVSSAQRFWDGKFWLINDCLSFPFESRGTLYYPNVWCRFELIGNEATAFGNHHTIDVVRLDPSEPWFGSTATLYDSKDTEPTLSGYTSTGQEIMQYTPVHEIGHLLGLNHVAVGKPYCPITGNANNPKCYGVSDVDKQSVMGLGMELRPEHAYAWRESMRYFATEELRTLAKHVRSDDTIAALMTPVSSLLSVWPSRMHKHNPRTAVEIEIASELA